MKIKEIIEVKKGAGAVNDMLKTGWEIVQVVGMESGIVYVMGKREEAGTPMPDKKK